jgi:hypothetical protein
MTKLANPPIRSRFSWLHSGMTVVALAMSPAVVAQDAPAADREDAMLAYAQCIRENGYAEFPDPSPDGRLRMMVDAESGPRLRKAQEACAHLAPPGLANRELSPEDLEARVALAQCIREHGVPEFPDPDSKGHFSLRDTALEPGSETLQSAMQACVNSDGPGRGIQFGG